MAFPSPARVGLFGISACLEAPSEKDQDEVEEATTEALSGCVCVCVCVCKLLGGSIRLLSRSLRN